MGLRYQVFGQPIPNIPWQEKSSEDHGVVWRYGANPVIKRHPIPLARSIYNSAVLPWNGGFAGVFRAEYHTGMPFLHVGFSKDGIQWDINHSRIEYTFDAAADESMKHREYEYDPRCGKIDDTYYVTWCNGYHGPTIGIASTKDFKTFTKLENAFLPFNRNGVLFPRKINGKFAMLSRPSDTGHTPFGDIFYSESPDMIYWGRHRYVMGRGINWWQGTKIGAGPIPIETSEGWLLIYHGVSNTCNGFVYSMGVAILDREEPWKVKYRAKSHILTPEADYETVGLVPNVCFPVAALCDAATGRMAIYYGAADTYTALAFTTTDALIDFAKSDS